MRRFEMKEGSSDKFWEIALEGSAFTVRFGKTGTQGQAQTKSFASPEMAQKEHDKLVAEKTKKGYREVGQSPAAAPAPKGAKGPLERLDAWLRANRPAYHASLGVGATPSDLAAIEKAAGASLPPALSALLAWKSGGNARLVENWSLLRSAKDSAGTITDLNELLEAGDFDAPSHWSPRWVPFLENGGGDHVCVDLGGSFGGPAGQVLTFWHDETMRPVLAPSLDAWLEAIVSAIEAGAGRETKEGFFELDAKKLAAARAKATPGYPQDHESTEGAPRAEEAAKKGPTGPKAGAGKGKEPVAIHPRALPPPRPKPPSQTTSLATLPKRPGNYGVAFSLSGARWAYTLPAVEGQPCHVVCDGDEGPGYEGTGVPTFAADGRLAYYVRRGKQRFTSLVGDQAFGPYDGVSYAVFSEDGAHFAVPAEKGKQALVVVDGVESELRDRVERGMVFAPDGRLAVAFVDGTTLRVELGGRTVGEHPEAKAVRDLAPSPDGKHLAYRVTAGGKHSIVVDGKNVASCAQPQLVGYSPSGELYWAAGDVFSLGSKKREDENVEDVFFEDDGTLYARVVRGDDGMAVLAGKKVLARMKTLFRSAFHAQTRRFAFEVIDGDVMRGPHFVVVGEARHGPYSQVRAMGFSPDGSQVHFGALHKETLEIAWHVVHADT